MVHEWRSLRVSLRTFTYDAPHHQWGVRVDGLTLTKPRDHPCPLCYTARERTARDVVVAKIVGVVVVKVVVKVGGSYNEDQVVEPDRIASN